MSLGDKGETAALRAMAHPIRLRILSLLTGAPMTAAEVARELDLTHANASYHVRNLLAAGLIVPAGEERIRGGVAKRYRHDPDRERHGKPTGAESRALYLATANELIRRTALAQWSGKKLMTDAELWVDPELWLQIHDRIAEASKDLHKAARAPRTPGTIRTSTSLAMFQLDADA
jgi:DNA-binding transcriptional ArsR family regulator